MTVTGPSAPKDAGSPEAGNKRREAILAAALDTFAERGFKGATIKALASAAGLRSPALLYWYFPNKQELFRAVLWRYLPVLDDDELGAAGRHAFDQPPEQFLGGVMHRVLGHFADPATPKAFWLLIREHSLLAEAGFSISASRPANVVTLVVDYLQEQVARGTLRPHRPEAVARLLAGQLNLALQTRVAPMGMFGEPPDDETLVADALDVILDGLRPRA